MTVVLVTGMSGTGKSTALEALAGRGFDTVDTDDPGWIEVVDGEPRWIPALIDDLLDRPRSGPLFVQGTVVNQGRWYPRFDAVVLLTAPLAVLLERVGSRGSNPFGRTESERATIRRDTEEIEPRLRAGATHVIDTRRPVDEVVALLLGAADPR